MERFFQILAVILAGVAAYFMWQGNADRAFMAAVFGAVSFFLSIRFQVKERLKQREAERLKDEDEDEDDDDDDSESPLLNEMPAHEQFHDERRTADKEKV